MVVLARSVNFDAANRLLTMINQGAAQATSCNLQSNPVHLEDTYCGLLNCLFGTQLVNTNLIHENYPGIDLIDEASLLCVQVTADTSAKKVRDTLAKPIMKTLAEKGYALKFCYVGAQNKNVKRRNPKNPHGIKFDASFDSILTTDILSAFNHLDIGCQEEVIALLRREAGESYVINAGLMREKLNRAIKQLGQRYTPAANVETPDMMRLAALVGDELFRNDLLMKARNAASDIRGLTRLDVDVADKDVLTTVVECFSPLVEVLAAIPDEHTKRADFEEWALRLDAAVGDCSQYPPSWYGRVKSRSKLAKAFEDARYRARTIESACWSGGVEYLNGRRVLVCGEAGIGKSHLLADLCERELTKGNAAVLVLGSQFCTESSSEESIPNILGLSGSLDDLLAEMQRYADAREGVAILAIDALNEGRGRAIWRNSLISLLEKVARYPSVRLVLSVRTTYKREVLPEAFANGEIGIMECEGFGRVSSIALETLCDYYEIARPTMPLIGMEFSNPLYLKLLCGYLHDRGGRFTTNVEMGDLVTALLSDVNDRLADSQKIGYDRNVPLVTWAVQAIACSSGFSYGSIGYEEAAVAVVGVVRDYISPPGSFLEGLVSEGLFNVVDGWGKSRLEFSYELVGNYVAALMITEKAKELQMTGAFGSRAEAFSSLLGADFGWISGDQGVLAALSTICPAEYECELFELGLDHDDAFSPVREAFVEGLPWRRISMMTSAMDRFIRGEVLAFEYSMREFFSMSFQLVTRNGGIDAKYYRELLLSLPMSQRDFVWSSTIARSEKAKSFVDWVWEHGDRLDERHAEPIATLLGLCLVATNVELRRKAIKALALVLMDRPNIAECLWDAFSGIDDDYALEGLCGAIYGAAVNSSELGTWSTTADRVVSATLNGGNAYPNAVVRDYVVLLSDAVLGLRFGDVCLDEPFASPWQSDWYGSLPSNEEIDALSKSCRDRYEEGSDEVSAVRWLVHSMTTEYGRGPCAYGDFGRYVLGRGISAWANQFESDQLLSNALTKHILTQWYDLDLHVAYDTEVRRFEGHAFYKGCERIGKKYQKIAMNRLIARLTDNFQPYRVEQVYRKGYEEHVMDRIDLLSASMSSGDYSAFSEAVNDDSDWVIGEKRELLCTKEVGCELLPLRSHDPSFPWKWSTLTSPYELTEIFPSLTALDGDPDDWCKSDAELPMVDELRVRHLNGRRFYTLAAYVNWKTIRYGKRCRESAWLSGALFVDNSDVDDVFGHYSGHSASFAFSDVRFAELFDGWGFGLLNPLRQSELFDLEKKVTEASYLYNWGRDSEDIEGEGPSVYLPCATLVDRFGLTRRGPFRWEDSSGKTVSYCLVDQETASCSLLFDANLLDEYIEETGQAIIWDDYFEKQTARLIYRKWMNAKIVDGRFRLKDSDEPYCGEVMRDSWMSEEGWLDA
ncbi:SMEK domain-containing protein [Raoultibacter timonensis]|uniref:SMEK domain-containing protein n=1 Tax=Raoultibacter timonensis TaxID=1907662 RepID=UPI000C854C0A|nr:SMEK domain-containing protein [Raoultibacter timonensis]